MDQWYARHDESVKTSSQYFNQFHWGAITMTHSTSANGGQHMSMAMNSSLIDSAIAVVGVIGVLMAFVAAVRGIEAPIMTDVRSDANETGAILKRVA
jgi:hypothetical protein